MSREAAHKLELTIGWGLLAVVALMPFHAFLSVWLGSITGHQSAVQAWKELVSLLLLGATAVLIAHDPARLKRLDRSIYLPIALFTIIAAGVTLWHNPGLSAVAYGIKTDFELILLFLIALLAFPKEFLRYLIPVVLVTSGIVAFFAVALVTILPVDTLVHFGYGHTTIEPFAYVGAAHYLIRTPSTLGGPNQLGSFLILPLSILLGLSVKRRAWWQLGLAVVLLGALYATYSRSAWLGAMAALLATGVAMARNRRQAWLITGIAGVVAAVLAAGLIVFGLRDSAVQNYLFHATSDLSATANSTAQHGMALSTGIATIVHHPLGLGLGSAGPASFHAAVGLIPENYFLQLAIETGVLGAVAFMVFCTVVGWKLWQKRHRLELAPAVLGTLIGLSLVNLFLHGWADSSTAFIYWILAGATLSGAVHVKADTVR